MDEWEFENIEKEDMNSEESYSSKPRNEACDSVDSHSSKPRNEACDSVDSHSSIQGDNGGQALTHRNVAGSDDIADEFTCSVCLLVAVQPTTLVCGHTTCRICLARWYFSSKKKECPLCRQPYQGHPKINAHVRNMIAKLCPKELTEREQELFQNIEDMNVLKKYDEELTKETNSKRTNSSAFCLGVLITFCVVIITYLAWYWQFSERNLLVMKPVQLWKPQDVAAWLEDLPWASVYANISIENNIDGNMLLAMDEDSLGKHLNISDSVHKRALLLSVGMLREHGVKMPSTLWEYKAVYPGRSLFLVQGLKEFPRTTILYLWMYFYDDMFLPFVKAATESADEVVNVSSSLTLADRISTSQWLYFLFSAAILPQWHVIVLAYHLLSHHFFSSLLVIIMATLVQVLEILNVMSIFRNNFLERRNLLDYLHLYLKQLLHSFMFMVAWPVIPSFVCDVVFYHALYIQPFYTFTAVCRKLRQHFNLI